MKYRSEIDGLRALAVTPVLFFHAGFSLFSGGYVGVDIFFVISGYLITTIIINDIENDQFSLLNFYERRARRILPALTFMILICIFFAWNWMLPWQIYFFGKSLIYVSLFVSNIFFWRTGGEGYFTPSIDNMPLLHTWSLGIEEQYYLIFPIFLLLTWSIGQKKLFFLLFLFGLLSLTLSEWGWRYENIANFYLTPTRAWELICGSLAAFIITKKKIKANDKYSFLGIFFIFFSIFFYDGNTPFPSVYTLIPVIGTLLIIFYAKNETLVGKILSNKYIVFIGLISYSTYLWHQPIFAFTRLRLIEYSDFTLKIFLILLSFVIGFLSWRFIERPFRNKSYLSRNKIFIFSFTALLIPIIIGNLISNNSKYFLNKITHDGNSFKFYHYSPWLNPDLTPIGYLGNCKSGFNLSKGCGFIDLDKNETPSAKNIIWGDSYAAHALKFVQSYEGGSTGQFSLPSCQVFANDFDQNLDHKKDKSKKECDDFNQKIQKYLKNNLHFENLIITNRFYNLKNIPDEKIKEYAIYFKKEVDILLNSFDRQVNVKIFPPPLMPDYDPSSCVDKIIVHDLESNLCDFKFDKLSKLSSKQSTFINELDKLGVSIYPLNKLICEDGKTCSPFINSIRIYRDKDGHLTNTSSEYFGLKLFNYKLIQFLNQK